MRGRGSGKLFEAKVLVVGTSGVVEICGTGRDRARVPSINQFFLSFGGAVQEQPDGTAVRSKARVEQTADRTPLLSLFCKNHASCISHLNQLHHRPNQQIAALHESDENGGPCHTSMNYDAVGREPDLIIFVVPWGR
jgi:hypothetical protein